MSHEVPGPGFGPGGFELGTDGPSAILVGVDDTVTATRAAWYAAGLARRQRARIIAVYVAPYGGASWAPNGASVVVAEEEAHDALAAAMRARAEAVGQELGVSIEFITAYGDAYREITRIARWCHDNAGFL